jgi:hypothetical protein
MAHRWALPEQEIGVEAEWNWTTVSARSGGDIREAIGRDGCVYLIQLR